MGNKIPYVVFAESLYLFVHCLYPSWILSSFGKALRLSHGCDLYHEGIVVCHVVVLPEPSVYIGTRKGLLYSGCLHNGTPNSLSIEHADLSASLSSVWSTLYVEMGLSFSVGVSRSSSSESMSRSGAISSDGATSGAYSIRRIRRL